MTAAMLLPRLILARTKEGTDFVNKTVIRRLRLWDQGKLDEVLTEAKAHQVRKSSGVERQSQLLKRVTEFMKDGNFGNAIRTLDSDSNCQVLSPKDKIGNRTVAEIPDEKHPAGHSLCLVSHESANPLPFNNSIFDMIDDNAIERAIQETKGSHGPSGLDSYQWRRILNPFDNASINLRKTVAKLAYGVATEVLLNTSLEAYKQQQQTDHT